MISLRLCSFKKAYYAPWKCSMVYRSQPLGFGGVNRYTIKSTVTDGNNMQDVFSAEEYGKKGFASFSLVRDRTLRTLKMYCATVIPVERCNLLMNRKMMIRPGQASLNMNKCVLMIRLAVRCHFPSGFQSKSQHSVHALISANLRKMRCMN